MSKSQPSQPATAGSAVALLEKIVQMAMSPDPPTRVAGWLLIAGLFVALAAGDGGAPLL